MRRIQTLSALVLMTLATVATTPAPQGPDSSAGLVPWTVDASHTEVGFSVRHFFTPVTGTFKSFDIELDFDVDEPEKSFVNVTIDVASIDTRNERRDNHLRSADFFDAQVHPTMTFESTSVQMVGSDRMMVRGNLTIKGQTREIELPVTLLGVLDLSPEMQEAFGGITQVASFSAETRVDRREFGVGVGNWAETVVVGADVDIRINLEANRR